MPHLLALAIFLLAHTSSLPLDETLPREVGEPIAVPLVVVGELPVDSERGPNSWSESGWVTSGKGLKVTCKLLAADSLQVALSNFDGYSGDTLLLQLCALPGGGVTCMVASVWHADVGAQPFGPNFDLHGEVRVAAREAGSRAPLRLAFELSGMRVQFFGEAQPMSLVGAVQLPLDGVTWDPALRVAEPVASVEGELLEVTARWQHGQLRSHGWVDARGHRQGIWRTYFGGGEQQTESVFLDGKRTGMWTAWGREDKNSRTGLLKQGMREGVWIVRSRYGEVRTVESGIYVMGRKDGPWLTISETGRPLDLATYTHGAQMGRCARWWPNGSRRFEGRMERGHGVGTWTYWNEDGSFKETRERKSPFWKRSRKSE